MNRIVKVALLLFVFALCGAATRTTNHAREQKAPPMAKELYSVVNGQLSAFRASDFGRAYRYAATGVQRKFSRSQFEQMIRRDFSSITQARHVEFGRVQIARATASVEVFLTAPDGVVRTFLYSFTAETDGWKIDGVQPARDRPARQLSGLHV